MNHSQRKYALSRIDAIEKAALSAIDAKHRTPGVSLTWGQKAALINAGKVKLKATARDYHNVRDAFDFAAHEREAVVDTKRLNADTKKCRDAFQKVRDEMVLGDASAALDTLRDLESKWLAA